MSHSYDFFVLRTVEIVNKYSQSELSLYLLIFVYPSNKSAILSASSSIADLLDGTIIS